MTQPPNPPDVPLEPLRLTEGQLVRILEHLREGAPLEACGILAGKGSQVTRVLPMRNAAASRVRFEIDPLEQLEVMKQLRAEGLDIVAIFHSHPDTAAYPSATDIQYATWWQDVWFLIVSLRGPSPEPRCFRILADQVHETSLTVLPDA